MKIFFFCFPYGDRDKSGYEHQLVSLAEGFSDLGFSIFGNVNYWQNSLTEGDFLIKEHKYTDLNEFDIVIFTANIFNYGVEHILPKNLFQLKRRYKLVFLDSADGFLTPGFKKQFRDADLILKSHFNSRFTYPDNFIPWQFGLTKRIIKSVELKAFDERQDTILSNFRISHQIRYQFEKVSEKYFYPIYPKNSETDSRDIVPQNPIDRLYWEQTGRRHYPSFYQRLGKSKIVNAVGGQPKTLLSGKEGAIFKLLFALNKRLDILPYSVVYQFDSWRFWESIISGCCTLHLDFEKYGLRLPVMPINSLHYIGVDLEKPQKAVKVLNEPNLIKEIAEQGRVWALENYQPLENATRLLNSL